MNDERRRAKALKAIREGFAAFGYDLDQFTDLELERALTECGPHLRRAGVTADEANAGFQRLASALQKGEKGKTK